MNSLSSKLSGLNPFSGSKAEDDEDEGETIDQRTVAGGGHAGKETSVTNQLRVSSALRAFLVDEGIVSRQDAHLDNPDQDTDALRALVNKPHAIVPPELTDRSHPLPDYFISSSHNTYLLAGQLYGNSSAEGYKIALKAGSRCVEIDAWDGENKSEPKVTHGYTLTSKIPFRTVCEAIRDVVDDEAAKSIDAQGYREAPIFISLENHCGAEGQQQMVDIMYEVWGDRLLSKAVRDKGTEEQQGAGEHVTLAELGSKIAVIVEYHFPNTPVPDDDVVDQRSRQQRIEDEQTKGPPPSTMIIPALADLGIYAQSVKPPNNAWFEKGILDPSPPPPPNQRLRNRPPSTHTNALLQNRQPQLQPPHARLPQRNTHILRQPKPNPLLVTRRANLRPKLANLQCLNATQRSPLHQHRRLRPQTS